MKYCNVLISKASEIQDNLIDKRDCFICNKLNTCIFFFDTDMEQYDNIMCIDCMESCIKQYKLDPKEPIEEYRKEYIKEQELETKDLERKRQLATEKIEEKEEKERNKIVSEYKLENLSLKRYNFTNLSKELKKLQYIDDKLCCIKCRNIDRNLFKTATGYYECDLC